MTDQSMVNSGDEELDATTLGPDDYVMVKVASKKATRHYVGMIVKPADEFAGDFEVTFLKEGIVDVPFDDIVARLPAPSVMGGTTLTKKMVFSVDLSQYCPQ